MSAVAPWFLKTGALLTDLRSVRRPGRLSGDIAWKAGASRLVCPLTTTLIGLLLMLYPNVAHRRR